MSFQMKNPNMIYGLKTVDGKPGPQIKASDLEAFYEEAIGRVGIKNAKEAFNSDFIANLGKPAPLFRRMEAKVSPSQAIAQFNQTGSGINVGSTTLQVTDLLREVGTVVEKQSFFSQYSPDVMSISTQVLVDTIQPITGAQFPRKQGQPFNVVQKIGNSTASFTPGYWGDKIDVQEQDIISLREIGTNNFALRGIAQYLALWTEQLGVRAYTLKQLLLQQAIFTGQFNWYGQTFSFGVPSENTLTPVSGQPWAVEIGGVLQMNPSALPLTDIRYYMSNSPSLRRLKAFIKGIVMNRNTASWLYTNPEVQQLIQYGYMANSSISPAGSEGITAQSLVEYFLGGDKKIAVMVDDSTYVADANDPVGNATNSVNYFIPDGQVLFVYDLSSMGGQTVDYVYTPSVQASGSFMDPRPGLFMVMEDLTQPGSYGGYETPSIKLLCGSNSMPRIKRPNDLFVLNTLG